MRLPLAAAQKRYIFYCSAFGGLSKVFLKNKNNVKKFNNSNFFNKKVSYEETILIYRLCLAYGHFELGYSIRTYLKECLEKVNLHSKSSLKDKIIKLALLLENQNYNQLRIEIKKFKLSKKHFHLFIDLINIIKNESICEFQGIDKEYLKFVKGKRIAIVGPAKTSKKDGSEIDSFDVILRLNYKDETVIMDSSIKGARSTISYFNLEQTQVVINNNFKNWPTELDWAIFNDNNTVNKIERELKFKSIETKLRSRNKKYNLTSFNTGYTALPKAVIDILRFKPAHVKIFHADFMLTVDREVGYKPSTWTEDMRAFFLEICSKRHDPVTQFYIMKNLCASRVISGDKRFDEVISLSPQQYMKELDKIYG